MCLVLAVLYMSKIVIRKQFTTENGIGMQNVGCALYVKDSNSKAIHNEDNYDTICAQAVLYMSKIVIRKQFTTYQKQNR